MRSLFLLKGSNIFINRWATLSILLIIFWCLLTLEYLRIILAIVVIKAPIAPTKKLIVCLNMIHKIFKECADTEEPTSTLKLFGSNIYILFTNLI